MCTTVNTLFREFAEIKKRIELFTPSYSFSRERIFNEAGLSLKW